jgi:hypothetical protein
MKTTTTPDGGAVIEMSAEEFENLTLLMGYAAGVAGRDFDKRLFLSFVRQANEIHAGRPGWKPYEIPEGEIGCRWCDEGNPVIRSSVSEAYVHTNTPVGRVVCHRKSLEAM